MVEYFMNDIQPMYKIAPKRKAIISLIFGILSLIGPHFLLLFSLLNIFIPGGVLNEAAFIGTYLLIFSLVSIAGLVFGMQARNSSKRKLAIAGISLSLIGLIEILCYLFLFGFALLFALFYNP